MGDFSFVERQKIDSREEGRKIVSNTYALRGMRAYMQELQAKGLAIPCLDENYEMKNHEACRLKCPFCIEVVEFGDVPEDIVDKNHMDAMRGGGNQLRTITKYSVSCMMSPEIKKEAPFDNNDPAFNNAGKDILEYPVTTGKGRAFIVGEACGWDE